MYVKLTISLFCIFGIVVKLQSQVSEANNLESQIHKIIDSKKAIIGVSVSLGHKKQEVSINADKHFPMQSVFKFHIAVMMLAEIDKGKFSFNQKVSISKDELERKTWSQIQEKYPDGVVLTVKQLLEYMLIYSDNIATDILLKNLKSPSLVDRYFKKHNFKDISIKFSEAQMQRDSTLQFYNWTTPLEMTSILQAYYYNNNNALLSKPSYDFLWDTLKKSTTGEHQLKARLPKNVIIAHKTGYSGINKEGVINANNDIGVVFMPDGRPVFISVFITNSTETRDVNNNIIADIGKLVWEHYKHKTIK